MNIIKDKTILITGGAGSLGQELVEYILTLNPYKIIIFSRDDQKHHIMEKKFNYNPKLRFFIGDVRDFERLKMAFNGVDYVIHTAALKHIDKGEYNSIEYKRTIVDGAENVIRACIEENVSKCVTLSTDKAMSPLGIYGASKLLSDKLFIAANRYSKTRFSVIRYGNVVASNGSIIQTLTKDIENRIDITSKEMTRFWITKKYATSLIIHLLSYMQGEEILIPKLPTSNVLEFLKALKPKNPSINKIPIRPAEKIHEAMILDEDARNGLEFENYYILYPQLPNEKYNRAFAGQIGKELPEGFTYKSNNKNWVLTPKDINDMMNDNYKF